VREIVADDGDDTTGQRYSTSDTEREQHQEEHDGEELETSTNIVRLVWKQNRVVKNGKNLFVFT
jgi:hypothetical protein